MEKRDVHQSIDEQHVLQWLDMNLFNIPYITIANMHVYNILGSIGRCVKHVTCIVLFV